MSSSSSEEEDLSNFAAAVDHNFIKKIKASENSNDKDNPKTLKSQRTLEESTHYNDILVPPELQNKLAKKLQRVIDNLVEFVEPAHSKVKKTKIKGGVKLFASSTEFLSAVEPEDTTDEHNRKNKHNGRKRRKIEEESDLTLEEKVQMSAVSADHIVSGEETKHWKSRRKEKLFKYRAKPNSNMLISMGN